MKTNTKTFWVLGILLVTAFIIRVYRVDQILGFYYDQGRDALIIWDLIHKGKFFLIGPTTGIEGIFRGPFYYYLIAPFYFVGQGNPVYPAVFLAVTSVLAIALLYPLGIRILNKETGIFALILAAFSYQMVIASRWLSNPTPMLLLSVILLWAMFKALDNRGWSWIIIAFTAGLSLFHFGSAGEVFYFPAIIIFAIWQRKNLPDKRNLILSVIAFLITVLPLALFDLKHGFIESQNIERFLFTDKSFVLPSMRMVGDKLAFFSNAYSHLIFNSQQEVERLVLVALLVLFLSFFTKLVKNHYLRTTLLLFISPLIGLLFFQGNLGNIYDYYLTGYYLIFILLAACVFGILWASKIGKVLVVLFFYLFLTANLKVVLATITDPSTDNRSVAFVNQKKAVNWIYQNAVNTNFNVDVYVPPVIPYAYDYLFKWFPTTPRLRGAGSKLVTDRVPLLYTVYEIDTPHPERLTAWLERQKGIGKVEEFVQFGGITVERRLRL